MADIKVTTDNEYGLIIDRGETDDHGNEAFFVQIPALTYPLRAVTFKSSRPRTTRPLRRVFFGNGLFVPIQCHYPMNDNQESTAEVGDFEVAWGDGDNLGATYKGKHRDDFREDIAKAVTPEETKLLTDIADTLALLAKVQEEDEDTVILIAVAFYERNRDLLYNRDRYQARKDERISASKQAKIKEYTLAAINTRW